MNFKITNSWQAIVLLLLSTTFFAGCSEDEPTGPPPTATFTTPLAGAPGGKITFEGTATDENGIISIHLSNADLLLDKTIELSDKPKSYELDYEFEIPLETAVGEYQVTITVKNKFNKSVESIVDVEVADFANYEAIWVGGGVLLKGWDTPEGKFYEMQKDAANQGWFEILLPSRAGFNELKFLGQNGWEGDNWGVVDNSVANSPIQNAENSEPIILPDLGKKPAYYKVRFNPNKRTYTFEEIIPSGTAPTQMFIVGSGFTGYPNLNWNPSEAIPMTHNPSGSGEWQFLAQGLVFSDDVALKFIGQNTGWSPIDVGFDENYLVDNDPNAGGWQITAPVNWKVTKSGDGTADLKFVNQGGSYTVYFDYFLKRAVIWKE
jgi:hypothetical protein